MILDILKWLIIVFGVILVIYLLRKFKHPRINNLNIFSGGIGTGKTSASICFIKMLLRRFYFIWKNFNIKHKYIILSSFPIGCYRGRGKNRHYCNYVKVFGRKFYCFNLELYYFTLQYKLPQDEVIIIGDEFNKIASQFDFNNPIINDNVNEFASFFRHYTHGKGYLFCLDQSISNIFLQIRRRCNFAYNFISCHKIRFLPITIYEFRKILISDDVQNVVQVKDTTDEKEIRKFIFITNPFKFYDSYAYSERYQILEDAPSLNVSLTFKRNDILKLSSNQPLYYACLSFDGLTEEKYYLQYAKKKK